MSEEFVITSDIIDNPKFLSLSVLARNIYLAMILTTDHEGRALADPMTWTSKAALFGPAVCSVDEVEVALMELDRSRLAPQYEARGKRYIFLPGRFEHNKGRSYWRSSKYPAPPAPLLEEFPEYAIGLRRLTTKGLMRDELPDKQNWRYPDLQPGRTGGKPDSSKILEFTGTRGELGENSLELGNDLDRDRDIPKGIGGKKTRAREADECVQADTPEHRLKSPPPSGPQSKTMRKMAEERGLTIKQVRDRMGVDFITADDVTRVMAWIKAQPKPDPVAEETRAKNARLRWMKKHLHEIIDERGTRSAREWIASQDLDSGTRQQLVDEVVKVEGSGQLGERADAG